MGLVLLRVWAEHGETLQLLALSSDGGDSEQARCIFLFIAALMLCQQLFGTWTNGK